MFTSSVKFIDEEKGIIEGIIAPYGGPNNGRDLAGGKRLNEKGELPAGEYFDERTRFAATKALPDPHRMMFHHGLDLVLGQKSIGEITEVRETPLGLWGRGILNKANEYLDDIKSLVRMGKLKFSTGADPGGIVREADGHIKSWPIIETSLTFSACNPGQPNPSIKALVDSYKAEESELETEALKLSEEFGIDPTDALEALRDELEHSDVTGGDAVETAKLVAAHLKKDVEYYSKEKEAMKSIKPTTVASFEEAESIKSLEANVKTATKAFPPEKKQGEADAPPAPPADEAKPAGEQPAVPAEGKPETPAQEAVEPAATEQAETPTQEAHEHGAAGKCPTCGQDAGVILPKPVQDALQALHDSIEGILPGVCANEAGATEPVATAEGDKPAQVSQPGTSQGMAPENHVAPEPAKPTGPEAESKSGTEAPPAPPAEEKKKPPFPPAKAIVVDDKKVTADAVKALLDEQAQTIKAVVEEARVLRERLAKVEGMPASGGPVRRVTEVTNPKQGTESPQVSRQAAIKTLLDDPDLDPALRINLAREDAVLSMNSVFAQGPKGLNGK